MKNKVSATIFLLGFIPFFFFSCSSRMNADKHIKEDKTVTDDVPFRTLPLWTELPKEAYKDADTSKPHFKKYKLFTLDSLAMQTRLAKAPKEKERNTDSLKMLIELPRPDSGFMTFGIYRTTVMDPALEVNYPMLRTYGGQGIEDRTATVRLDFNPNGFHAYVISQSGEWFIQPAAHGITYRFLYCFFKQDVLIPDRKPFEIQDSPRK